MAVYTNPDKVLPIAISVRRTNVYEEKSLGIWGSAENENEDENEQ